jgi:hypothetical protein
VVSLSNHQDTAQTLNQALLYILTVIFATMWGAKENALTWFNQAGAFLCTVTFLFQRQRSLAGGAQESEALDQFQDG